MKAAIYSRKSKFTGKGDSIGNQIQLCREYADFYLKDMNITDFLIYEDHGFSGGTLNRPEFKRLISDAVNNTFKILICYRLDRISRNVGDFSNTLNLLQRNNIIFISIREQFDTSTPMGKAMAYISSVFAQLERETISERIRDNMLELAKSGRWLGGQVPLGFKSEKTVCFDNEYRENYIFKLSPLKEEIDKVNIIFSKYIETKSIHKVLKYLLSNEIKGKNGGDFSSVTIRDMLRNPLYAESSKEVFSYLNNRGIQTFGNANGNGILTYNKRNSLYKGKNISEWIAATGKHKGIIPKENWLMVQSILDENSKKTRRYGTSKKAILSGLLKCSLCGSPMRVTYGRKKQDGERVHYYACTMKCSSGSTRCNNPNVPGDLIEKRVIENIPSINEKKLIIELKKLLKKNSYESKIKFKELEMIAILDNLKKAENREVCDAMMSKVNALGIEIQNLKSMNHAVTCLPKSMEEIVKIIYSRDNHLLIIRNLLEKLIFKITWDGNKDEIKIYLSQQI
ncbi:MAG: recombinase family protein [Solirubrobacterales bacterium]